MISIIIPAHNEEAVIGRCLDALFSQGRKENVEVVVVCNGCVDKTAELAREYEGVNVVELEVASKIAALNAGDSASDIFPRVYLDADITCSISELESCIGSMGEGHGIAAPTSRVVMNESSWLVRAYLATWMELPYYKSGHMVGSGIYILTKEGRSRFDEWPQIIADDAYVRALFKFDEIFVDSKTHFEIYAPHSMAGLIKIRTRARFGNMEVEARYPKINVIGENSNNALVGLLLRKPFRCIHWLVYVAAQLVVLKRCKAKLAANDYSSWERDDSARVIK